MAHFRPKKPDFVTSVTACKCPHCRKGRIFRSGTYDWQGFAKMHSECPVCGQDLRVEPGFFVGASYLHYGFTAVVTTLGVLVDLLMGGKLPLWGLILSVLVVNTLLFPPSLRIARSIMLHLFGGISFDPSAANSHPRIFVTTKGVLRRDFDLSDADFD